MGVARVPQMPPHRVRGVIQVGRPPALRLETAELRLRGVEEVRRFHRRVALEPIRERGLELFGVRRRALRRSAAGRPEEREHDGRAGYLNRSRHMTPAL